MGFLTSARDISLSYFFRLLRDWPDSLMAMAIACFLDFTLPPFPPGPDLRFPSLYSSITLWVFAFLPLLVVGFFLVAMRHASSSQELASRHKGKMWFWRLHVRRAPYTSPRNN